MDSQADSIPVDQLTTVGVNDSASVPNRVLVVEESKSILALLCAYINNHEGIEALPARSLLEAMELIASHRESIFCAVSDLVLPDSPDGEIVDSIHEVGIPVIVLTGTVDASVRETMLERNVLDYVVKSNTAELEFVAALSNRLYRNHFTKVLVVDDSASYRTYLANLLARYGYITLTADNGANGLEVLAQDPDTVLVITDLNMPVMDGLEFINRVRELHKREEIAIIGLSDSSRKGVSARLLKAGANDFIPKGFEIEEFYCRVTQNTELIHYVRQVRDTATRDFLTRIHNRNHLFDVGVKFYENARRGNIRIAAALIDADHFKGINDTHGHHVGDEALKAIARCLTASLRSSDIVARYGGEEFVCLVLVNDDKDAGEIFERVRQSMEAIDLRADDEPVPITVSIGVSLQLKDSLDHMLQVADEAVYKAKNAGRNCVVCI